MNKDDLQFQSEAVMSTEYIWFEEIKEIKHRFGFHFH